MEGHTNTLSVLNSPRSGTIPTLFGGRRTTIARTTETMTKMRTITFTMPMILSNAWSIGYGKSSLLVLLRGDRLPKSKPF